MKCKYWTCFSFSFQVVKTTVTHNYGTNYGNPSAKYQKKLGINHIHLHNVSLKKGFGTQRKVAPSAIFMSFFSKSFTRKWMIWIDQLLAWSWKTRDFALALPLLLAMWPLENHLTSQIFHFLSHKRNDLFSWDG